MNFDRAFNVREGLTRKDNTLPRKFLDKLLPDGLAKGRGAKPELTLD